jgi:ankyrin repeat protein
MNVCLQKSETESNVTSLIVAIKNKQFEMAQLFIDQGADLNIMDMDGHTALMLLAGSKNNDKVHNFLSIVDDNY